MTQDIFTSGTVEDIRTERAQRAVRAFRAMQPGLSGYARAITGRKDVSVELAQGTPRTDGKKIYFKPPIALGDLTPHTRRDCERRDRETAQQLCPACRTREEVLITIYHEIAHIVFGTFAEPSNEMKRKAVERAIEEAGSKYAARIKAAWDQIPSYKKNDYLNLSSLISPFLPVLVNALEDARVDEGMFKARKGTKVMFDAYTQSVFRNGIEGDDGTFSTWAERPLNSQAIIGVFVLACRYDYEGWFHPQVEEAMADEKLRELVARVDTLRSAEGSYNLAFPILARLRELGFCRNPDDPQDEEQEEDDDTPESNEDEAQADEAEAGSGEDEEGDPQDDGGGADGEDGEASEGADGDPQSDGSGDPESDSGTAPDADEDGGSDSEPRADSGDDGSRESEPDAPGEGGSDEEEADAGDGADESESDEAAEPSGGGGSEGEAEPEGTGEDSGPDGDASDAAEEAGPEAAGPGTEGESEAPEAADDESGDRPEDSGGDRPADDRGESGVPSDAPPANSDRPEQGELTDGDPSGDGGEDREPEAGEDRDESGDQSGEEVEPTTDEGDLDDVEVTDSGADEGEGGTTTDTPDYGTAEEALGDVQVFGKHEAPDVFQSAEDKADEKAVDRAIIQGQYFEKPSANIQGVREHKYGQPLIEGGHNMSTGWEDIYGNDDYYRRQLKRLGIDADTEIPEQILGPALLEMRRTFSDNARAAMERHMRSGKINQRVLGKRAWAGDDRLFQKKRLPGRRSYAVLIGIDISGSTVGVNIALAKRAAMAQAELCYRAGIDFAVYAHTANGSANWGRSELWLDVYEIKSFDAAWNDTAKEALNKISSDSENLDGHTIEYYRKMIERHPATDKVILYYSDGKMPAANHDEELEILQREILYCKSHSITLMGVGIRTDSPRRHGLNTVQVDDDSDIAKVVRHLQSALLHSR